MCAIRDQCRRRSQRNLRITTWQTRSSYTSERHIYLLHIGAIEAPQERRRGADLKKKKHQTVSLSTQKKKKGTLDTVTTDALTLKTRWSRAIVRSDSCTSLLPTWFAPYMSQKKREPGNRSHATAVCSSRPMRSCRSVMRRSMRSCVAAITDCSSSEKPARGVVVVSIE